MTAQATPTNGTHDTVTPQIDLQSWRDAVAMVTQRAADHYGEELHGRIEKARRIVLAGLVQPGKEMALIASETDPETQYEVTSEGCSCLDAERKAPQGMCKHRLAWQIYRVAYGAAKGLAMQQRAADSVPADADEVLRIPTQFIVLLHGRQFVTFGGLLAMAHERGLQSLTARFITVQAELATAEATAVFEDGRSFVECGDATPGNVNGNIKPHFARMALTRAKARALRDALNIGMCSFNTLAI